jgi:hypothetical protein
LKYRREKRQAWDREAEGKTGRIQGGKTESGQDREARRKNRLETGVKGKD